MIPAPCKHFQEGSCRYGTSCRLSHCTDPELPKRKDDDTQTKLPPPKVCTHWLKGTCKHGDGCKLSHSVPAGVDEEALRLAASSSRRRRQERTEVSGESNSPSAFPLPPEWGDHRVAARQLMDLVHHIEKAFAKDYSWADKYELCPVGGEKNVEDLEFSPDGNFVILHFTWEEGDAESERYHRYGSTTRVYQLAPTTLDETRERNSSEKKIVKEGHESDSEDSNAGLSDAKKWTKATGSDGSIIGPGFPGGDKGARHFLLVKDIPFFSMHAFRGPSDPSSQGGQNIRWDPEEPAKLLWTHIKKSSTRDGALVRKINESTDLQLTCIPK